MIDCREVVGVPFKTHGRTLKGFDCLGLCLYLSKKVNNKTLPDVPYKDIEANEDAVFVSESKRLYGKEKLESPEEGCWIEFESNRGTHIGFYIGSGMFVHASSKHKKVVIDRISGWKNKIKGYYRV